MGARKVWVGGKRGFDELVDRRGAEELPPPSRDIAADDAGNVYVTGYSISSGTYSDYATVKYNTAGVEQWAARYSETGTNSDRAYALAVDG